MTIAPGTHLGPYEILARLGAGGMGEVWRARDTRLDREVAIKVLPAALADDEEWLRRFEQEARATSSLNHPNILTIYDIGTHEGGPYIVAELLEGAELRDQLNRGSLSLDESLGYATQIASGLAAAHAKEIVHRDIKPENIFILKDGRVKILDFGLAKLRRQSPSVDSGTQVETRKGLTDPGVVMGTTAYMSPEQARGQSIDARSDVFSLGVVLYEMIAGAAPFTGECFADILVAILDKAATPLTDHMSEVPFAIDQLVSRCLAKRPEQRHQSAAELLIDLKSATAQLSHSQSTVQPSHSIAVLPFVNMSADPENEYFCDGLAEEMLNALAKINALRVASRTSAFSFKDKNATISEIGRALNVSSVLEGSVRKAGNRLRISAQLINVADGYHLWSERYDREMKDIFDIQDEISMAIVDALKVKLLGDEKAALLKRFTENADAYQSYLKGRHFWYKFPRPGYEKAREYFQQAIDLDPTYALGYCGLADYFGFAAAVGLMPPEEGWPKLELFMNKALALDDGFAEVHNTKAALHFYYYRDWPAAEREFQRSIELNPKFAEGHHHYGVCLASYGRWEDSVAQGRRALELDPLSLRLNLGNGRVLFWAGRYDRAIAQYRRTLDIEPNFATAHEWLGDAYEQTGQHSEAVSAWSRALMLQGNGELSSLLERTFAASGFTEAIRALSEKQLEHLKERQRRAEYIPAMAFVSLYLRLQDREQTMAWFAKAVPERNRPIMEIGIDPRYESLRSDPQFASLAQQMKFTNESLDRGGTDD